MKKKIFVIVACVLALSVPLTVFAATSDSTTAKAVRGFFGVDASKLTDQQKADVSEYNQKMVDLQKEFINKMVANGAMTAEQGDAAIKRLDEAQQNGQNFGLMPGIGFGGKGMDVHKGVFGNGWIKLDISNLTDQQKADLTSAGAKLAELKKDIINSLVSNGTITQEQGDAAIQKISDEDSQEIFEIMPGGFNFFGLRGIDASKLTDQQKTDLKDSLAKVAQLQKEIVNTLVGNGTITKEKGDALIERIDAMSQNIDAQGLNQRMPMKQGFRMKTKTPGTAPDSTAATSGL